MKPIIPAPRIARRFDDEWIARLLNERLGVAESQLERLRARGANSAAQAAVDEGLVSLEALQASLHAIYGLEWGQPRAEDVDRLALNLVDQEFCRRRALVPLRLRDEEIEVAMAQPLDADALSDLQARTGRRPRPLFVPLARLEALLNQIYDPDGLIFGLLGAEGPVETVEVLNAEPRPIGESERENVRAPVIRLVDTFITRAVRDGASDIHIDHDERASILRFRVDGDLRNIMNLPRPLAVGPVLTRLKIMAGLDIANRLRPQDGRAALRVGGRDIGLRVSTLPTQFGEKAVLRLLDPRSARKELSSLGLPEATVRELRGLMQAPEGLVLMTGPTGSGKTTTLYSLLNSIRSESCNIVTIEDPIEYRLEGINQVQVRPEQGLSFANALRSVLRQDPDVIMVGEIRDQETAQVAVQAAMTGHLVLASLHANDAASAVSRLLDMGVESYKLAAALRGCAAQRLVRRLCSKCRIADGNSGFYKAVGCEACALSGHDGRLALLELLRFDGELRQSVGQWQGEDTLRVNALKKGLLTDLAADALAHAKNGDCTREEIQPFLSAAAVAPEPAPSRAASARTLIVDDDGSTRTLLRAVLEQKGLAVDEAQDGLEALDMLGRRRYDLVLTDLHMPHADGHALIRRIRAVPEWAMLPVLILTTDTDERNQELALQAGADDYLAKPFKPALVAARVLAALRRGRAA